jgi:drug/metabolite transporter (DMT)-like permease
MERQAVSFALLAVSTAVFALLRGAVWPRGRQAWACVLAGVGLFVAPAVILALSSGLVSTLARVALFSLVPVFTVVLEPYMGPGDGSKIRGGLIAALAALVGMLCIFPVDIPGSIAAGAGFCAVIVAAAVVAAANCFAVRIAAERGENSIAPVATIAATTAALALIAASAMSEQVNWKWTAFAPELAWSAALELPALLLLFWLMKRMSAARMTTRFVLAPLITTLFSLALLRPSVGGRGWLGILLLAAGAGWILLAPTEDLDAETQKLRLNR